MGMEFTNNPASARRVLLSLELDFSNMSDWQQVEIRTARQQVEIGRQTSFSDFPLWMFYQEGSV